MRLKVLWVGKTQEEWLRRGIDEYTGRIKRYIPFEILEVREEKGVPSTLMRERETARLSRLLSKNHYLVLLDELGEEMPSQGFASFLSRTRESGTPEVTFVIGGAYGVTDSLHAAAVKKLSLSRMTMTHQMVRLFLLEQIYRGFTIINGEGYHH